MRETAFPNIDASIVADDGDAFTFCTTCAFSRACLSQGMDKSRCATCTCWWSTSGRCIAGDHVFREGDAFEAIAAVRSGTVKTYSVDRDGREHVLGFHLPGEGDRLNAIDGDRYPATRSRWTGDPVPVFVPAHLDAGLAPAGLQQTLFRLLSRDIGNALLLAGTGPRTSDGRVPGRDVAAAGRTRVSPRRFQLTMGRGDIANYLRLAPETVSRVLKRFQHDGLIKVDRREVG